ncbi:MAG: nitrilase-related carbon-nitrogen hydrolase [Thermoanaerobaculales bacterium]|jgi:predicted amidohydrolase|nr:nitrilase-related carbon-nitrogen hydrolase [Thermoanaerobaculales bacterium]
MKVFLSRWVCQDVDANLLRFEDEVDRAVGAGAEIVVFPELFLTGYTRKLDVADVRERFARLSAAAPDTCFVYGSISEKRRNRVTVWSAGEQIAHYDKIHLFRPNGEFDFWDQGDRYVAVRWNGLTIGLMNCNDMRFPEQARALVLEAGADLIITPAWWPWRRDWVWSNLLRARAIENAVWTLGCCIANSVFPGEDFAGAGNHVFSPLGEAVRTADDTLYDIAVENPPQLIVDPREEAVEISKLQVF